MLSFWTILSATAPVFIIISIGFFMHRRDWLGEEMEVGMMHLALNLLVPCLILDVIPGNPSLQTFSSAIWALGIGFGIVITGFAVAALCGWMVRFKKGEGLRTFTICAGIQNYGYLPIPIIAELFSPDSGPMGLVFVHGVGVELALWTVGLVILTGKTGWRSLLNGPFLAVVAALFLNYTGWHAFLPKPIHVSMAMLGQCAIPISIFLIGATMGRYCQRDVLTDIWRASLTSIVVRMVLLCALIVALAKFLPISEDLRKLLVVQAAMPTAVFPIMLSRIYGGSPSIAIQVVLATSLVSIISSPFVIAFGLAWIGVRL